MRRVGALVAETLRAMRAAVRPGVTTGELDEVAAAVFRRHGARSGPQETYDFPGRDLHLGQRGGRPRRPGRARAARGGPRDARRHPGARRLPGRRGDHRPRRDPEPGGRAPAARRGRLPGRGARGDPARRPPAEHRGDDGAHGRPARRRRSSPTCSATGSAASCTSRPPSRTSTGPTCAASCRAGSCSRSSPWSAWAGRSSRPGTTAGPSRPPTARSRPTWSTRWSSTGSSPSS